MSIFLGKTIKGDGRGRELGFPTLNISLFDKENASELYKNSGVFIVELNLLTTHNLKLIGLLHLGSRPTFNEKEFRIEIFVLEKLSAQMTQLSEKEIVSALQNVPEKSEISFIIKTKIREVVRFNSAEKLVEQINKDVETAYSFYE